MASFGAAIGLIILATDPFAQATISLYSCARNGTDPAIIPRANNFTVVMEGPTMMDSHNFDTAMQLASYRGILEPPQNRSVSVDISCTSGNCTFPADAGVTLSSVTMCSGAWDISDRITASKGDNGYVYSLPSNISLTGPSTFAMGYIQTPDTGFRASESDVWNRTSILDVYLLSMVRDNSTECELPQCTSLYPLRGKYKPSAFVFSLFPCVQTVSANVQHGYYTEKVVSEEYLHYISNGNGAIYQLAVNQTIINGTWGNCVATQDPTESNTIPVLVKSDYSANPSHVWHAPECVFEFSGGFFLGQFLGPTFFSTRSQQALRPPSWVSQLWRNGTTDTDLVAKFAEGLAISIGARMRAGARGPDMLREARGTTQLAKTCIRIHWEYIAFFAAIFILEALFLVSVIIMSYKSKLHSDWKSSALAVAFLSAGHRRGGEGSTENIESEETLRDMADNLEVQLESDSGHWRLRTNRNS